MCCPATCMNYNVLPIMQRLYHNALSLYKVSMLIWGKALIRSGAVSAPTIRGDDGGRPTEGLSHT